MSIWLEGPHVRSPKLEFDKVSCIPVQATGIYNDLGSHENLDAHHSDYANHPDPSAYGSKTGLPTSHLGKAHDNDDWLQSHPEHQIRPWERKKWPGDEGQELYSRHQHALFDHNVPQGSSYDSGDHKAHDHIRGSRDFAWVSDVPRYSAASEISY